MKHFTLLNTTSTLAERLGGLERKDDPGGDEKKNADAVTEVKNAFGEFMKTFEAFKTKTADEIAEVKKKGSADTVTKDEVKKLNDALDEQGKKLDALRLEHARPMKENPDGSKTALTDAEIEHKKALSLYMRKGIDDGLAGLEAKALSVGSNPDGGYLVTDETETTIDRIITEISPIRSIASVRKISTAAYKKPINLGGAGSGWVGEKQARPETAGPTVGELEYPAMELYANPMATQSFLDDARVDVEAWIADEVNITFAEQEGAAFVQGNSNAKPQGFIGGTTKVAQASWAWGKIGYIATGASGAFKTSAAGDQATNLIDLVYSLKNAFRLNARFVTTRLTLAEIRKFRDSQGNMVWQPSLSSGQPQTILGFPVTEAEDMDEIGANTYSIAFGDFRRGYLIVDRMGVRVLRDPYSNKPYVSFYTTKRVGGGIQHFDAIKLLKFGSS